MADQKKRLQDLRGLRQRYPHVDFKEVFVKLLEDLGSFDRLQDPDFLGLLEIEEQRARESEDAHQRAVAEMVRQLRVSEMHHQLGIGVLLPSSIDLEHAQAILAYGIALPGSKSAFVGARRLEESSIHRNVANKLCARFDEEKFQKAFSFLKGNGVIVEKNGSFSFDSSTNRRGLTSVGLAVVSELNRFLHNKK